MTPLLPRHSTLAVMVSLERAGTPRKRGRPRVAGARWVWRGPPRLCMARSVLAPPPPRRGGRNARRRGGARGARAPRGVWRGPPRLCMARSVLAPLRERRVDRIAERRELARHAAGILLGGAQASSN